MEDELPNEFDLLVVGTGFSESIVAAASSRIGKTVLHLDPNEFYGGVWSSFNLEALQKFIENSTNLTEKNPLNEFHINENSCKIIGARQKWSTIETNAEPNENDWTKEKILKEFRKFNIDLSPKLLFSYGKLVDLLISSNICRYAEFRACDHICTIMNNNIKNVPCSRTDVFNTKDLTIIEKRLLMKLLTNCMSYDEHPEEFIEYENKTFLDYLKANKLTENIIHCVLYAISMSNEKTIFKTGVERTKKFLHSLGRYGNTPFLFPMYGCGEIPQCFCRLCAVFGGIYCLKRSIDNMEFEEFDNGKQLTSFHCGNQNIKVKNIVLGNGNIPDGLLEKCEKEIGENNLEKCGEIARGIFITSTPLGDEALNSGGGGVNLLKIPGENNSNGAFVMQLSHYSGTCPKGLYLIHITCESRTSDAEADLKIYTDKLFTEENSLNILYSTFFIIPKCEKCSTKAQLNLIYKNIYTTCGPFFELDYDLSIENAKEIFTKIYPNEIFLPRAPDPEEIIIGDEDPINVSDDDDLILENNDIIEQIQELEDGIENQVRCIEENSKNEEKDSEESVKP